jgi:glycine/D-amino acid oxidase-like deaminating enzyme
VAMKRITDVVVIGGGIMGTSTTFRLAERGLKVTLVEKGHLASGSTGKSSAIIRQHYSNETTARMALHSLRVFQNFADIVGDECGFRPVGFVVLAAVKDRAGLEANVALQQAVGIQTRLLSDAELCRLAPGIAQADELVAAYEPEGGYADPWLTVNAFGHAARRQGATILLNSEVVAVKMMSGRVTGVVTTQGEIVTAAVVNTAGPWGGRIARMVGVALPVQPCRVQVALFVPPPGLETITHVFVDFAKVVYYRPETGGLVLAGSVDPQEAQHHADPDHYHERADLPFIEETWSRLAERFPVMARGASREGYAGIYDVTPDWHPVIDEVPPGSGFFVAVGHSGHGFKLAPAVGVMVADLVTGQQTPGLDPALFRLARYAEGKPVRGRYEYSIAG